MSLNKKKMVREIGRRTRLKNGDVQSVIEALIDVWTEELVGGGRIEMEGFLTIRTQLSSTFFAMQKEVLLRNRVVVNTGKLLRQKLNSDLT